MPCCSRASDQPPLLSLVLYHNSMDTRRLHCVVVGGGERSCHIVRVSGRDALVVALQFKICHAMGGAQCANDLELFLARPPEGDTREWLTTSCPEMQALAYHEGDALRAAARPFTTSRNAMFARQLLFKYLPVQPALCEGTVDAVHVLVCISKTLLPSPSPPLALLSSPISPPGSCDGLSMDLEEEEEEEEEAMSVLARLVATMKSAEIEHQLNRTNGRAVASPPALLVRSSSSTTNKPHGCLWLTGDDDDEAQTSYYVPTSWRRLASEISDWILDSADDDEANMALWWRKGRRALVTGAPRSGKTVFLSYLLLELVRGDDPPPCVVVDFPGVVFALVDGASGYVMEGTRDEDFDEQLRGANTVYLFDATSTMPDATALRAREVIARSIVVVPQRFIPTSTKYTETFVLPQWKVQSVRECARLCYPDLVTNDLMALYHKWGGLPGRLFGRDLAVSKAELEHALDAVTPSKIARAIVNMTAESGWNDIVTGTDAAVWKPLVVLASTTSSESFEHDGEVVFTSQYVCDRVLEKLAMRTAWIRQRDEPQLPRLWNQIRKSLVYLAQEEEEKHSEAPSPSVASRVVLFPKPKSKRVFSPWVV